MTTLQDHFSIGEDYKYLKDILDQKARQGDKSKWICKTLLEQFYEEQNGQQDFDKLLAEQKRQDELNSKMDQWLILVKQINVKQLREQYSDRQELADLESSLIMAVHACREARGVNLLANNQQNWRV